MRLLPQRDIGIQPYHVAQTIGWINNVFTPDISKLETYRNQLVFVCDEFMSDRRQHFVIEEDVVDIDGVRGIVRAFTKDKFNHLLAPDGTALSVPNPDGRLIMGELMVVKPSFFKKVDKLKQNRILFIRKRVPILDPYRDATVSWENAIDNGWFDEDGRELPLILAGKKGVEYTLGPEKIWIQEAWMYFPHSQWDYQLRRRPELFTRVPIFSPKKDKAWLSEYTRYQNPIE
jgi:hypothetical protein